LYHVAIDRDIICWPFDMVAIWTESWSTAEQSAGILDGKIQSGAREKFLPVFFITEAFAGRIRIE
jgi:hypothetical protein